MIEKEKNIVFICWAKYQRRSEVLAKVLGAEILFLPNIFENSTLRIFDYLIKFLRTFKFVFLRKPNLVFIQSPPTFICLVPLLFRIEYIVDIHNTTLQSIWNKEPLLRFYLGKAKKIIVHNSDMLSKALKYKDRNDILIVNDPLLRINNDTKRENNKITFICSFAEDEPLEVILEVIERLPNYHFFITANVNKLGPSLRNRFFSVSNLTLTGFLSLKKYHDLLLSSRLLIVLTNRDGCQPSGACEAISSNTGLILSRTSLTVSLFGESAILVNNNALEIIKAIENNIHKSFNHEVFFNQWNNRVSSEIDKLKSNG